MGFLCRFLKMLISIPSGADPFADGQAVERTR